jgi:hypothetical protein
LQRAKTRLDVAQTLAVGQLSEGQTEELVETREAPDSVRALISRHAAPKLGQRQNVHSLVMAQMKGGKFIPAE